MNLCRPDSGSRVPAILTGACIAMVLCSCSSSDGPTDPPQHTAEIEECREMARSAFCTDIRNRLFLIDGQLIFWDRAGNCADAGYAQVLMDSCPNGTLCYYRDTIAGPDRGCEDERYREIFDVITANLDEPDLGLGPDRDVEEIPL